MATTYAYKNGTGNLATTFPFTFPYIKDSDVKVEVLESGAWVTKTKDTHYEFTNATTLKFLSGQVPVSGTNNIKLSRSTDADKLTATFYPGSAIRSVDLNDNFTQNLYSTEESKETGDDAQLATDRLVAVTYDGGTTWTQTGNNTNASTDPKGVGYAVTQAEAAVTTANAADAIADAAKLATDTYVHDGTNLKGSGSGGQPQGLKYAIDQSVAAVATANSASTTAAAAFQRDGSATMTGNIVFEGATDDAHETTLTVVDPTADRTITLPNETGTVITSAGTEVIDSDHYVDGSIDNVHIAAGQITSDKLNAATVVTAGEQAAATANDTSFFTTSASDARYFNVSTGETIKDGDTFPDNDTTIATTAAINDRIIDIVDDVGGFVPLVNEAAIPAAHPEANNAVTADRTGTIISIGTLSATYTPSSGTCTIPSGTLTNHSVNATITDCGSTTLSSGFGVLVETTAQTDAQYAAGPAFKFHRLTPKATEVTTVAGVSGNITTVAGIQANVTSVAGNETNINAAVSNATNINAAVANATNINAAVSNATNINAAVSNATNINTVASNNSNVTAVAGKIDDVETVADNITDVSNFADLYQIATSAPSTDGGGNALAAGDLWFDSSSNKAMKVHNGTAFAAVTPTQSVLDDISIVSGSLTRTEDLGLITDAISSDSSTGALDTCATNITNINAFANTYFIASSAPTGGTVGAGDLWYDSTGNVLKYYTGSAWTVTAGAGLSEISEDTTPELGGNLDCNNKNLTEVATVSGDNLQIDFGTL